MPQTRRELLSTLNQFYYKPVARVSLELLLSVATVIFFALFAIRPTLVTMSDLIKEIEDKRALDQQLAQKIAALSTAQTEYLTIQTQLPLLDQALPKQPHLVDALKIIERTASESNIIISNISVAEIPPEQPSQGSAAKLKRVDVPITLAVTGEYVEIRQFVENLKNNRRTFAIDTVAFTVGSDRGKRKLQARMTISLPYLSADGPAKTEASTP